MRANGFNCTNSTTHFIAKGCYVDVVAFGKTFRVLAAPQYR